MLTRWTRCEALYDKDPQTRGDLVKLSWHERVLGRATAEFHGRPEAGFAARALRSLRAALDLIAFPDDEWTLRWHGLLKSSGRADGNGDAR